MVLRSAAPLWSPWPLVADQASYETLAQLPSHEMTPPQVEFFVELFRFLMDGHNSHVAPLAPARDPPYFKSRALRRKLGELEEQPSQVELFAS